MDYNNLDMDREIVEVFYFLMKEKGLSAKDALEYLDYDIFIRHNDWFHALPMNKQDEIRMVLHAIKLVHK
jgi:hypothetical protein